jgi:hypothetical protein
VQLLERRLIASSSAEHDRMQRVRVYRTTPGAGGAEAAPTLSLRRLRPRLKWLS